MNGWMIFGFLGQFFFGSRFFIQWILSELKKTSYVPTIFWYLSILGGLLLFVYALHIKDPVFIVGHGAGIFIYSRNIALIRKKK
ncbi:MAG: lipid-A-disaccharide synthase N-terminal domain-containing protein [Candidatus Omnitrophota bacterium]|nr:MAG: lipid-A-disaccharide synthase N-terminal domain-containing protein [Candidatus Omnitrophota bacterium]